MTRVLSKSAPSAAAAKRPPKVDPMSALLHELDTPLGVALTASSIQEQRINALVARCVASDDSEFSSTLRDLRETAQLARRGLDQAIAILGAQRATRSGRSIRLLETLDFAEVLSGAFRVPVARFDDRIVESSLEVDHDLLVQTDPEAWKQVITNLVANSVLHGFKDRPNGGSISVSAARSGAERVTVIYRDDGRGFSAHARTTAFVREYTSGANAGSSGLGLCITRDIVHERLRGTIELLDSREGAAIQIDVPIRRPLPDFVPTV